MINLAFCFSGFPNKLRRLPILELVIYSLIACDAISCIKKTREMKTFILTLCIVGLVSCSKISEKTKETINQGGEVVGKTATEFIEGVGTGIEETLSLAIVVSDTLTKQGLHTGKYYVTSSDKGTDHVLNIYLIFDKSMSKRSVVVKAFDKDGVEMGRVVSEIQGAKDEAKYLEIVFDHRTNLENKGKITIE